MRLRLETMTAWAMQVMVVVLLCVLAVAVGTGCRSVDRLAQSQEQAKLETVTENVRLAAAARGDVLLAQFLSEVPKMGGAAGFTERSMPLANPDGSWLLDKDGHIQYGKSVSVGLSASMRDMAGLNEAMLVLGGQAINPKTGEIKPGPYLNGLFLYFTGQGVSSGPNAAFAQVWADAPATEKQAAADAVAKSLMAFKGLLVEAVTAGGQVAQGILREVYKATPVGAASAAVEVLIETAKGPEKGTITAPFTTVPSPASGQPKGAE